MQFGLAGVFGALLVLQVEAAQNVMQRWCQRKTRDGEKQKPANQGKGAFEDVAACGFHLIKRTFASKNHGGIGKGRSPAYALAKINITHSAHNHGKRNQARSPNGIAPEPSN